MILLAAHSVCAQEFNSHLDAAKKAYAAGNLEDARFEIEQMLTQLDIQAGKEVIKLLPAKMDNMDAVIKNDNVTANTGFTGVLIHREYTNGTRNASVDLMGNSPMLTSVNAILSMPFVANSGDGTQKVVKVQGYKSLLQKNTDSETDKVSYDLSIPFGSTLLTFKADDADEAATLKMANTIPLGDIVKKLQ
jgi:hypothetical protein